MSSSVLYSGPAAARCGTGAQSAIATPKNRTPQNSRLCSSRRRKHATHARHATQARHASTRRKHASTPGKHTRQVLYATGAPQVPQGTTPAIMRVTTATRHLDRLGQLGEVEQQSNTGSGEESNSVDVSQNTPMRWMVTQQSRSPSTHWLARPPGMRPHRRRSHHCQPLFSSSAGR